MRAKTGPGQGDQEQWRPTEVARAQDDRMAFGFGGVGFKGLGGLGGFRGGLGEFRGV